MLTAQIANELIPELERTTSYRAGRFGFNFQPEVSRNALAGKNTRTVNHCFMASTSYA